jgi:hypothetical protein
MNGDPARQRVLVAQGIAALAYFFCIHGAHAAVAPPHAQDRAAPTHAALVSTQLRPA